jgi:hypothetical protein
VVSVQARQNATVLAIEITDNASSKLVATSEAKSEIQVLTSKTSAVDDATAAITALTTDSEPSTVATISGN